MSALEEHHVLDRAIAQATGQSRPFAGVAVPLVVVGTRAVLVDQLQLGQRRLQRLIGSLAPRAREHRG